MTINVYYKQEGKKLLLFTDNTKDFDFLNRLFLWAEKLGAMPDEDMVTVKIIKSLPLQNQITIASDFLFTKMPKLSWAAGGSVVGMLQDNGINLIPKLDNELQEPFIPKPSSKLSFWNRVKLKRM